MVFAIAALLTVELKKRFIARGAIYAHSFECTYIYIHSQCIQKPYTFEEHSYGFGVFICTIGAPLVHIMRRDDARALAIQKAELIRFLID